MNRVFKIGEVSFGSPEKLSVIAGPCVIESQTLLDEVAGRLKEIGKQLEIGIVFKSSFDKANRTSLSSFRGPGFEKGLNMLASVKKKFNLPLLTDVHEPWQAKEAQEVVDILQVPAFLCRQTDLILACANTGKALNIKKGQFLAPWDVRGILEKASSTGNEKIIITERGTTFGYNRLVVDMCAFPIMAQYGYPVCFDVTHSVQQPGGKGDQSGGNRAFVPYLARAGVAIGVTTFFFEVHPDPDHAPSDGPNMVVLDEFPGILLAMKAIHQAVQCVT